MRALEDPWVHIHLSFVCTLCHLLCCFFLLLFLTWTFANIFELHHSMCSMLFFFLTKGIPSHLAIDSLTQTHTYHTKNTVTQNHLGILAAQPPNRCRHLLDYFFIFISSFFLALFLLPFFTIFLTTRKENLPNLSPLFNFRVCSSPQLLSDTMAHMLSISFQLRHGIERSHSYIS